MLRQKDSDAPLDQKEKEKEKEKRKLLLLQELHQRRPRLRTGAIIESRQDVCVFYGIIRKILKLKLLYCCFD